jgi:hypothetical protein
MNTFYIAFIRKFCHQRDLGAGERLVIKPLKYFLMRDVFSSFSLIHFYRSSLTVAVVALNKFFSFFAISLSLFAACFK